MLEGVFDYAGLYPPANLTLRAAVEEYTDLLDGPCEWLVNNFISPADRLQELEAEGLELGLFEDGEPLGIVATLKESPDLSPGEQTAGLAKVLKSSTWLEAIAVEAALPQGEKALAWLKPLKRLGQELEVPVMLELGWNRDIAPLMEEAILTWEDFGFKARMGGLSGKDTPSSAQAAAFIAECRDMESPFKFTAGLHSPLRHHDPLLGGERHGFLNVLGASLAAVCGDASREEIAHILDYQGAGAFAFGEGSLVIGGATFTLEDLEALSEACFGIGSCSIQEPYDGLVRLGLIEPSTS